ncbi:hypothetical protein, partial [Escherichia coli]|uniref:hypothetical protein n=1 Tax=Escherichia coli TaxID=562 RepID=UPI0018086336
MPAAGGYAGAAAGFELGSMAAPFAGPAAPVVPFIGAIGGMIAGSMATEKAQDAGLKALGVDDDTQRALNAQANP